MTDTQRRKQTMSKKKKFKPLEIPILAMCSTPGCGFSFDMTKGELPGKRCPKCKKELEVWGLEVSAAKDIEVKQ